MESQTKITILKKRQLYHRGVFFLRVLQMKFEDVQKIFFDHIHRRYHRFCRELFAQLLCLNYNIKPAYLFDLFPFSLEEMRTLLDSLSNYLTFPSILLKYSLNDLIIVNTLQLGKLMNISVLLIDLTTMTSTDSHPMLDKVSNSSFSYTYDVLLYIRFVIICRGSMIDKMK